MDSYLSKRVIQFIDKNGKIQKKPMEAGVPQGSVLGPVLWNIAFDRVLAEEKEYCNVLCYADDTLVVVTGKDIEHTHLRACVFVTRVVNYIHNLGLKVAANKTEAILFHPKGIHILPAGVTVGDSLVTFQPSIKYLGIMVDRGWTFNEHMRFIEMKVSTVVRALNRLMPNLRGPSRTLSQGMPNVIDIFSAEITACVISLANSI